MVINCTGETVFLLDDHQNVTHIYLASSILPQTSGLRFAPETIDGVPYNVLIGGTVTGLPEEISGTTLIVTEVVAALCSGRKDLVVCKNLVRDEKGRVVGCKSLGRIW